MWIELVCHGEVVVGMLTQFMYLCFELTLLINCPETNGFHLF